MTHQNRPDETILAEPMASRRPSRTRQLVVAVLCIAVAAAIAWAIFFWPGRKPAATTADAPVPVVLADSRTEDVPVYLDGLGTVQAFNMVNVRVLEDGPLIEVRFSEGQNVRAGDVLAVIDPRPYQAAYDQAVAKKAQDEAQLANARLDLSRYQKLVAQNFTSAQTADTARAQVAQLEAQVRQDQAAIDSAKTNLSRTQITAPIDGRTGLRTVDNGNIVHPTDLTPLTTITQLHPISVVFTLPQQDLPAIARAAQSGTPEAIATSEVTGGAAGDALDRGTLATYDNQVDTTTGTIKLKATFPNADNQLWPGAFVVVRLHVRTLNGVVTIPEAAVQRGPNGTYVYLYDPNGTVSRRLVTIGHEDEQLAVVTAGLPAGARVVTEGAARLTEGSRVSVSQTPAPPSSGAASKDGS
jgi:membrane fusion protein, multidrug efflux system